jgi:hypothetical protein
LTEKSSETSQDLFEESHKCVICGRPIRGKNENPILIAYHAHEKRNLFVEPGCMNLLKKFEIAYGKEFFVPESSSFVSVAAHSTPISNMSYQEMPNNI